MLAALQRKFRRVEKKDASAESKASNYLVWLRTMIWDLRDENQALRLQLAGEWDGEHVTVQHECDEDLRKAINFELYETDEPANDATVAEFFQRAVEEDVGAVRHVYSTYQDSQS